MDETGDIITVTQHSDGVDLVIKLFGEIPEPGNELVSDVMFQLETYDIKNINVLINTYGGSWDTAIMLYNVLQGQKVSSVVRTYGISSVFSAGQIIYMAGDVRLATNYTDFLIHTTQLGLQYDNQANILNYVKKHTETVKRAVKDIFQEFLSEKELEDILENGKDLYFDEKEAKERDIVHEVGYLSLRNCNIIIFSDKDQETVIEAE